jgi:N utilization substance protein A
MSAKVNTDFISAIYQIAEERGLDQEVVLEQVKKAYLTAYKKMAKDTETGKNEEVSSLAVEIDLENGEITILKDKKVVSVLTDPNTQILESHAKLIDPKLREGDHIQIDVTPDNFGRIAAQAAFQRLLQGLKDAELESIKAKYEDKVGKIISGVILKKDQNYIKVEVEKAEAIMPLSEAIPGEIYKSADRKRFLLVRLQNSPTDKRMLLSRGSSNFLKALFEVEVPEIAMGSVQIVSVAREAGSRSKVAVQSLHEKVDAIGACVGPKGTRIDTIMNEVSPEKVDIILFDPDIKNYIVNALSPAKVVSVKVYPDIKKSVVLVSEDMLSLAIGKDGQNVRLAAKLTGYQIDITADKEKFEIYDIDARNSSQNNADQNTSMDEDPVIEDLNLSERQKRELKKVGIEKKSDLYKLVNKEITIDTFTSKDINKVKKILDIQE